MYHYTIANNVDYHVKEKHPGKPAMNNSKLLIAKPYQGVEYDVAP
jgi:hypothetical protein